MTTDVIDRARRAFLRACQLDVAVRKPGNVSLVSPGHRMDAGLFLASADAAASALFVPGQRVGARIEAAMQATLAVAHCNTNLGIVLLCAPIAAAAEQAPDARSPGALRAAIATVLAALDVDDAAATYRAIASMQPAGLGQVQSQDVHKAPSIDLRGAMTLAADRDSVARQYATRYGDIFDLGLPACDGVAIEEDGPRTVLAVQLAYLVFLATLADSHIVRKHGASLAHSVMTAARIWLARARIDRGIDDDPAFAAWDETLKNAGVNPGTSADLTVATLFVAGLSGAP